MAWVGYYLLYYKQLLSNSVFWRFIVFGVSVKILEIEEVNAPDAGCEFLR